MTGEQKYCTHASCRTDAATELAYAGAVLQRKDLRDAAREVYSSTVRCRHQPRKGALKAPFPTRKA